MYQLYITDMFEIEPLTGWSDCLYIMLSWIISITCHFVNTFKRLFVTFDDARSQVESVS